jgi:DNA-binding CsgD family transcriptional regulator
MNRAAREIVQTGDGLSFAAEGPVGSNVPETRRLREVIRALASGTRTGPEWLRLSRPSGAHAYELALCRPPAQSPGQPAVTMFIATPDESLVCDVAALRALYGLTHLEALVAESVASAKETHEIAASLDLSVQTTRWYVQQVREKMGALNQKAVIRSILWGVAAMSPEQGAAPKLQLRSRRHRVRLPSN